MRIIRARDLIRTRWKNGGGTTAEIAAHPDGATLEGFGWRLSLADVETDGPFSAFPGIDRTLMVVEGVGIVLRLGGAAHRLDLRGFLSFEGGAATVGQLVDGPIRDLNVMTRRGRFTHRLAPIDADGRVFRARSNAHVAVLALANGLTVETGGAGVGLDRLDCLLLDPSTSPGDISVGGPAALIEIEPVRSSLLAE